MPEVQDATVILSQAGTLLYSTSLKDSEIRLLSLVRLPDSTERCSPGLQCSMSVTSTEHKSHSEFRTTFPRTPVYTAVSYAWHETPGQCVIPMQWGQCLRITTNLYHALQQIWQDEPLLKLWVDALCISQVDDTEKSEQVARMGAIFGSAACVTVWLGPEKHNTVAAWNFVYDVANIATAVENEGSVYGKRRKALLQLSYHEGVIHHRRIVSGVKDIAARSWFQRA